MLRAGPLQGEAEGPLLEPGRLALPVQGRGVSNNWPFGRSKIQNPAQNI